MNIEIIKGIRDDLEDLEEDTSKDEDINLRNKYDNKKEKNNYINLDHLKSKLILIVELLELTG